MLDILWVQGVFRPLLILIHYFAILSFVLVKCRIYDTIVQCPHEILSPLVRIERY